MTEHEKWELKIAIKRILCDMGYLADEVIDEGGLDNETTAISLVAATMKVIGKKYNNSKALIDYLIGPQIALDEKKQRLKVVIPPPPETW